MERPTSDGIAETLSQIDLRAHRFTLTRIAARRLARSRRGAPRSIPRYLASTTRGRRTSICDRDRGDGKGPDLRQVRVRPIDTRAQLREWLVRILTAWSARRFR
jgi:hypothetical protein